MSTTSSPLFLGLDLSTQQIKAVLISEDSTVVHESAVHFDNDLPTYGTTNGAIRGPGQGEVTSPVAMWLDAIDLLMERMSKAGVDFQNIAAISGAGQVSCGPLTGREATDLTRAPLLAATRLGLLVFGSRCTAIVLGCRPIVDGTAVSCRVFPAEGSHLAGFFDDARMSGVRRCRRRCTGFGGSHWLSRLRAVHWHSNRKGQITHHLLA